MLHWRLCDDTKGWISVKNIAKHAFLIEHTFFKHNCVHTSLSPNCAMLKSNLESQAMALASGCIVSSVRPPLGSQNGIKMGNWVKSSAINQKIMIYTVFD